MRMDVHSQYEEEYQLYIDATKELQEQNEELENKLENIRYYLDNEIPHEFINEATNMIYKMV